MSTIDTMKYKLGTLKYQLNSEYLLHNFKHQFDAINNQLGTMTYQLDIITVVSIIIIRYC